MSVTELKQQLMKRNKITRHKIRKIKRRIEYMEQENEKAIKRYRNSKALQYAAKLLHREGKTKLIVIDGEVVGYEYDWGEAILKLHEIFEKEEAKKLQGMRVFVNA